MALTRAQLLTGDSNQGSVIPGQVQGVKSGPGVIIASDGTISFQASSSTGVVKTNNPAAYNTYIWPAATAAGGQLTLGSGGVLSWVVRNFGFGINFTDTSVKVSLPFGTYSDPATPVPQIGSSIDKAIAGSLYWNSESQQLFICNGTSWVAASYGPSDLNKDLLSGTSTLYVNPETGSDIFVTGFASTTPPITNQMVTAGYTPQKPFKTLQRAALEVARTQRGPQPDGLSYDRFVIQCSAGVHEIDNSPGIDSVSAWVDGSVPTNAQLRGMNSLGYAGLILPRGVSVIGQDLRKTIIRPTYVPNKTGDINEDRGSILRITGGGFFFNFTFKDKQGWSSSHHLLDCFSFCSDDDLVSYYGKVEEIFSQPTAGIPVNPGETEIVAPQPIGVPEQDTDGIIGASPYIFNCSVRSAYGLCGINADGNDVTGFKSMVTAQFTGVSLQRDLSCWQKYNTSTRTWGTTISNYDSYIALDPNNLRMNPDKVSFHVRAINGAFIQEVSVFAIGQGIHHWAESGGELSITNSNSSFGGCAALASGYKSIALPQDTNWNISRINTATNLADVAPNVNVIGLGVVSSSVANNSTVIYLNNSLLESEVYPGTPEVLALKNYSLVANSYVWVENSSGPDWRALLTTSAWSASQPNRINLQSPFQNENGSIPGSGGFPSLAGCKVYIRRMSDSRTLNQRRYSLDITSTDSNTRTPLRDYVLQTTPGSGGGIVSTLSDDNMLIVNKSGPIPIGSDSVVKKSQIVLGRANPVNIWTSGNYYRPGDTVRFREKHFTCVTLNSDVSFNPERWSESYVQMPSNHNVYDFFLNTAPIITFNNDTSGLEGDLTCGYNLTTCWSNDPTIKSQYTTATDYRGVYQFLIGLGFSDTAAANLLTPKTSANRSLNPASSSNMEGNTPTNPDGAANVLANWPIEFRRPSTIRMFGHAWEWAGYLNYTKALPFYQGDLSAQNQFTYYFTNSLGGRVHATGFNQEGFSVSAAGLTDLSTGAFTGVTDIGNPFVGIDLSTFSLLDGSVTTPKLADGSVTTPKLADGSVTTQKLSSSSALMPIGGIIMWSGTIANIPTGWALCNGSNSTPDLRNRFIVGATSDASTGVTFNADTGTVSGAYAPGNTGGETAHQLTIAELASHTHRFSQVDEAVDGGGAAVMDGLAPGTSFSPETIGGDDYHENRPPYYALAFIMRVS